MDTNQEKVAPEAESQDAEKSAPQSEPVAEPEQATTQEGDKKNIWAVIAYLIFFLPLITDQKDDPYVKFHVKQGLVLFISFMAQTAIAVVPVLGWIAAFVLWVMNVVLLVIGIINAATGKQKELPLIGKLAVHFDF